MSSISPLSAEALYRPCDPDLFDFQSSDQLPELDRMLGQQRAVEAIELGIGLELDGFNLFVLGPPGTGRHSYIRQFLGDKAAARPAPSDWCYINNFDNPRNPIAIALPAGRGRHFRDLMARFVNEAATSIPAAFESEDYQRRRQAIEKQAQQEQEKAFAEVQRHAEEQGVRVIHTSTGFQFQPLRDGEPVAPEQFRDLPTDEQQRLQENINRVGEELNHMLQAIPRRVRKVREQVESLNREAALFAVDDQIQELREEYNDHPRVLDYLKEVREDIAEHLDLFLPGSNKENAMPEALAGGQQGLFQESEPSIRYAVNLVVENCERTGARLVVEDNPTYQRLLGKIEHTARFGALSTNFTLIQSGALHQANGGYLVVDAAKLLTQPFAWDALKRALKGRCIRTKSLEQEVSLVGTVSLDPEPIPLDVKVVLIGDRPLYHLLQAHDPEFMELFKVAADFEDDMARTDDNSERFARLLASIGRRENLRPLGRAGMARLIEESSRQAGDAGRLSTHVRRLADLMREAHYWARASNSELIGEAEVQRAVEGQDQRMGRVRDALLRQTMDRTLLIDTEGEAVGQINGLAVLEMGGFAFGRPSRITARVSAGNGRVIDIEREVELGGPFHSKGVLILSNFLASQYISDQPLSLSASLVFEQSYGPIEGDSASAAELCALLSALARVPIRQSLAITGSVNQHGEIQAIGGVNQKIEGFFDLCRERGLNGTQGVIIPAANARHLMLRGRVREAVAHGDFHIYAASHVDQCMEVLTGLESGNRDEQGQFPEDSLNRRVLDRLLDLAEKRRRYASAGKEDRRPE